MEVVVEEEEEEEEAMEVVVVVVVVVTADDAEEEDVVVALMRFSLLFASTVGTRPSSLAFCSSAADDPRRSRWRRMACRMLRSQVSSSWVSVYVPVMLIRLPAK